jgi:hypothetical protein
MLNIINHFAPQKLKIKRKTFPAVPTFFYIKEHQNHASLTSPSIGKN